MEGLNIFNGLKIPELKRPHEVILEDTESTLVDCCICFLNTLEGFKTRCKNLHWSAPKKNIHVYLDEFLEVLIGYQDALAEEYMGIKGQFPPNIIIGTPSEATNSKFFIEGVREKTLEFYKSIPGEVLYAGIKSECETFIHNINKYTYLFSLCNV